MENNNSIPHSDMLEQIEYLTKKCNMQVDELKKRDNLISELEVKIKNVSSDNKTELAETSAFMNFWSTLYIVIESLIKSDVFIKLQSSNPVALSYEPVEINALYSNLDESYKQEFIQNCKTFNIFRINEKDGKVAFPYKYKQKSIRVIYISKRIIDSVRECEASA